MIKAINIVGLIGVSASYIYIIAIGAQPNILISLLVLNIFYVVFLFFLNKNNLKKLSLFFLFILIGTFLYINQNGTEFIVEQWSSKELYFENSSHLKLLIGYMSLSSGTVWTGIFSLFTLDKKGE
jgi:uncharacterized membrane protein YoaT (DUF817 family)